MRIQKYEPLDEKQKIYFDGTDFGIMIIIAIAVVFMIAQIVRVFV